MRQRQTDRQINREGQSREKERERERERERDKQGAKKEKIESAEEYRLMFKLKANSKAEFILHVNCEIWLVNL